MEFTLLWSALTGVGALYGSLWWMGRRDTSLCVRDLWEIAIAAGMIGLAAGRIVAMLRGGVNPLAHPGDILLVRAGVDTAAASLAALLTAGWLAREDLFEQLDGLAPAALFGLAGWHAGCLFRGACLGTLSDLPWAWALPGSDLTRHPVELYAALILAVAAVALFRLRLRYPSPGLITGLAMASAGAARLATEPLRPSLSTGPMWWYAAVIGAGICLAGWALWRNGRIGSAQDTTRLQ
ncbi:MAG: prolipoprotein diacylglyceryl transferase family protein [Acidimicrobiia bacterium]